MERDRVAVLTVRAAVNGIIDYRDADIMDRKWWQRWRILVNEMTSQADKELLEHLYAYHLALVSNSGLSEDSFKSTQDSARENFDDLVGTLRPWVGRTKTDRHQNEYEQFKANWQRLVGWDVSDPKLLKEWQENAKSLAAKAELKRENEAQAEIDREANFVRAKERVRERRARIYSDRRT